MEIVGEMKRLFRWFTLAICLLSLTSCGLPMAAARSAGRLVQAVGGMAGAVQ
jgi:hypothetical protein